MTASYLTGGGVGTGNKIPVDDVSHPLPVALVGGASSVAGAVWGPDASSAPTTQPPVAIAGRVFDGMLSGNPGTVMPFLVTNFGAIFANLYDSVSGLSYNISTPVDGQASLAAIVVNGRNSLFNGSSYDVQRSINGSATSSGGMGVMATDRAGSTFAQITTATTTAVKGTPGILKRITVNTAVTAATIKIYNAATATGTPITITCPTTAVPFQLDYDLFFSTAITVVTSGATDVTVGYR